MSTPSEDNFAQFSAQLTADLNQKVAVTSPQLLLPTATALSTYIGAETRLQLIDGRNYKRITSALTTDPVAVLPVQGSTTERWVLEVSGALDARHFGISGVPTTNDVPALQAALDAAAKLGISVVQLPPGRYKIAGSTPVRIPTGVSLLGSMSIPNKTGFGADNRQFDITIGEGSTTTPAFILAPYSGIQGFSFYYPNQLSSLTTPIQYGYAISSSGVEAGQDGFQLRNLMLTNPYLGIKLDWGGQHTLENIMGQPLSVGILIDRSYDVNRLHNIHFWPFFTLPGELAFDWIQKNGTAYKFAHTDQTFGSNLFEYGYKKGMHLTLGADGGAPWVSLSNVLLDVSDTPLVIDGLYKAQFTNLTVTGTTVATSQEGVLIQSSVNNLGNSLEINGFEAVNFTVGIRNKGKLRMLVNGSSKFFYVNQNNGVRWYEIINENNDAIVNYNTPLERGDSYKRISGKVTINGATSYTTLTDVTPAGFATPHAWSGAVNASAITGGSRFNLGTNSGVNVASFPMPAIVQQQVGLFVLELTLKNNGTQGLNVSQFYLRLRDYSKAPIIDFTLFPSAEDFYFQSETVLRIPFVYTGYVESYIELIYGNNITTNPITVDITGMKLLKATGYSSAFVESLPRHAGFNGSIIPVDTEPVTTVSLPAMVSGKYVQGDTVLSRSKAISSGDFTTLNLPSGFYAVLPAVTGMPYAGSNWLVTITHHEDSFSGGLSHRSCIAQNLFNPENVFTAGNRADTGWQGWSQVINNKIQKGGISTQSGDGTTTQFSIPHGLAATPTSYQVMAGSDAADNSLIRKIVATATALVITYKTAPVSGTNNLSWSWSARL